MKAASKREFLIAIAKAELAHFVMQLSTQHALTYDESIHILASQISVMAKGGAVYEEVKKETMQ